MTTDLRVPLVQSSSRSLALAEEGLLNEYVVQRILLETPLPEGTDKHAVARRILKVAPIVFTMWANYYFMPMNNKAAGSDLGMRILLNYGNWTSCVCLDSWVSWQMIDHFLGKMSPEEKAILHSQLSTTAKTSMVGGAFLIATFAKFSVADIASKYNDDALLPAIVLYLSDGPVTMVSSWLAMEQLAISYGRSTFEKQLSSVQQRAVDRLTEQRMAFLHLSKEEQLSEIDSFNGIKQLDDIDGARKELLALLFKPGSERVEDVEPCAITASKKGFFGLGILLSTAYMGLSAKIAYNAGKATGGDELGIPLAAIVVAANIYLNMLSVSHTAEDIFSDLVDYLRGKYVPSMGEQLRPGLAFCIKALGLVTTALSYGGSIGMADAAFDDEIEKQIFGVAVSIAFSLFTYTAFNALSRDALTHSLAQSEKEEERSLVKHDQMYSHFTHLVSKSSVKEFARFLGTLPDEIYEKLIIEDRSAFRVLLNQYNRNPAEEIS